MNVCPEEIRVHNRRKELASVRRSPEYRERQRLLVLGKNCIWCGRRDHLLIHHTSLDDYRDAETYIRTLDKGWVMCGSCHRAYHNNRILCPVCKERYTKYATCYQCMPQERKDEIIARKVRMKLLKRRLNKQARARFLEKIGK